ncbi:hypothetical protein BJV78DRAFT_1364945 [Lactifluus subvellereus]|nr:hypothetical protein BJV78DRAFT_1364945 [Lactifluus subvellereus]
MSSPVRAPAAPPPAAPPPAAPPPAAPPPAAPPPAAPPPAAPPPAAPPPAPPPAAPPPAAPPPAAPPPAAPPSVAPPPAAPPPAAPPPAAPPPAAPPPAAPPPAAPPPAAPPPAAPPAAPPPAAPPPPGDKNPPSPVVTPPPPPPVVTPGPAPPNASPSPPSPPTPNPSPTPNPPPSNPTPGSNTSPAQNPSAVPAVVSTTSTSIYTSLVVTTAPDGEIVTSTLYSTIVIYPSLAVSGSGGSSNTGAIAGAVAGGIGSLTVLLFLGLLFWRRKRRRDCDEQFDGTFDPARVLRDSTGHTDLTGVTPYSYEPGEGGGAASGPSGRPRSPTSSRESSMRKYHESQALLGANMLDMGAGMATGTSGSRYDATPSFSDSSSSRKPPSIGARSNSLGGGAGPSAGFPVPQPYRPLSAKERRRQEQDGFVPLVKPWDGEVEVVQRPHSERITMHVPIVSGDPPQVPANVPEDGPRVGVIQHSDGGRVDSGVAVSPPREIPPSYESIPGNDL